MQVVRLKGAAFENYLFLFFSVKGNSNQWLKAKPALYPTLIVGVGEIAFNVVHLGRTEWTIYSLFVLNFIVTPAVYTCVVAFIPVV